MSRQNKTIVHLGEVDSEQGIVRFGAIDTGLIAVSLPGEKKTAFLKRISESVPNYQLSSGGKIIDECTRQLCAYLKGELTKFSLPLIIRGTSFQKKVLKRVSRIPYGETMSYGSIAESIGHIGAARAVGTVNACNQLPLVIPCHRVVSSTGVGGYGGGIDLKIWLLELESAL